MKKALITGATGYIGFNLLQKILKRGWNVAIIKRASSNISNIKNITSQAQMFDYNGSTESLKQAIGTYQPEVIFHLASSSIARHKTEDIENLIQSNILFGTQLLEAMQVCGIDKIVNTSTSWQTPGGTKYKSFSLYTALKQAFEDILQFYANVHGIKSVSLRLPDTYGPNDSRAKILNLVQRAARSGELLKMSAGEQEMDLLYIDDIVDGLICASELLEKIEQNFNVYSLSSNKPMPLRRIIEIYEQINGILVNIEWGALPYRDNEIMKVMVPSDILPSWKSRVSLEDGLRKME